MNLVKNIEQFNTDYVYFCDPIKNNIMNEGNFIRILYSTNNFVLNGIYLIVTFNDILCEKYYSKYRCCFNVNTHIDTINSIKIIEEEILKKYESSNKIPQYKINEQLRNGNLKIFTDIGNKSSCSFILKISGIWETEEKYGLTYKFIKIN